MFRAMHEHYLGCGKGGVQRHGPVAAPKCDIRHDLIRAFKAQDQTIMRDVVEFWIGERRAISGAVLVKKKRTI